MSSLYAISEPGTIRSPLVVHDVVDCVDYPILLAHAVFHALVVHHREHFEKLLNKGLKHGWQKVAINRLGHEWCECLVNVCLEA